LHRDPTAKPWYPEHAVRFFGSKEEETIWHSVFDPRFAVLIILGT
jgi:hypothetical protein